MYNPSYVMRLAAAIFFNFTKITSHHITFFWNYFRTWQADYQERTRPNCSDQRIRCQVILKHLFEATFFCLILICIFDFNGFALRSGTLSRKLRRYKSKITCASSRNSRRFVRSIASVVSYKL